MATPEEERQQEQQRRAAAAAVAGGTLVTVGDPLAAPVEGVPSVAARAAAAGKILAALVAFLAIQRARLRAWMGEQLRRRHPTASQSDIDALLDEEQDRQAVFETKQAERFSRDLTTALAIPDAAAREGAIRGLVNREKRYAQMREEAMSARAFAALDRVMLRQGSPNGAFWKLDPTVIEHTAGCLIMGNKFWPWAVLDRVHPPRHPGCPCRLVGYGEAIAKGLMSPGAVLDAQVAIRRAAAVVMEGALVIDPEDADALIELAREGEPDGLRAALVAAGLADEDALDESFNPRQPRDFRGRWKEILGKIEAAHPDVSLSTSANDDGIVLSKIGVNDAARGKGAASKALDALLAAADREGKVVALTPDPIGKGGLSKTALTKWYRAKGFVPNKGRAKDYAFRETMIRQPQVREDDALEEFDPDQARDPLGRWVKVGLAVLTPHGPGVVRGVARTQAQVEYGEGVTPGKRGRTPGTIESLPMKDLKPIEATDDVPLKFSREKDEHGETVYVSGPYRISKRVDDTSGVTGATTYWYVERDGKTLDTLEATLKDAKTFAERDQKALAKQRAQASGGTA